MANVTKGQRTHPDDPFLLSYNPTELRIAAEFLSTWLPFLSRGLCRRCSVTIADRIRSLDSVDGDAEPSTKQEDDLNVLVPNNMDLNDYKNGSHDDCNTNLLGSWKDSEEVNDTTDTNSLGSWKDGASGWSEPVVEASKVGSSASVESPKVRMSWADMAQEDELEEEEENDVSGQLVYDGGASGDGAGMVKVSPKTELSRQQREYIRFSDVKRKKDFICLERVNGKICNILDGLELHTGVFSAAEQKRIVDFVYVLEQMGKNKQLKERTYSAPRKWMRGKGRVTIQFGCCYNYSMDSNGNPPGILQNEPVDPIPHLFKVIIRRLVRWHVLPSTCVPDSCIVNIYDEGDCIPPHIDNHDFVRPFCTVSFLSECNIVFGTKLKVDRPGEFSGAIAIPLPMGSVLVFNGKGADVAKHCVPAVHSKRISITFRKMDESKWPIGFAPELDLQGLERLPYEGERSKRLTLSKSNWPVNRQGVRREDSTDKGRGLLETPPEPRFVGRARPGPPNRQRVRLDFDN